MRENKVQIVTNESSGSINPDHSLLPICMSLAKNQVGRKLELLTHIDLSLLV